MGLTVKTERTPSKDSETGLLSLDAVSGVKILKEWEWNKRADKWTLHCELNPSGLEPGGLVPPSTKWYTVVEDKYPWGTIRFFPAKDGGIVQTFHHQTYNALGDDDLPWRKGRICLDSGVRVLGRHAYDVEPIEAHERLRWHFARALEWLRFASRNQLVTQGEPFELPDVPLAPELIDCTVAFSEDPVSYDIWKNLHDRVGLVEFVQPSSRFILTKSFFTLEHKQVLVHKWGYRYGDVNQKPLAGIWLRLDNVPVLPVWQMPCTWGELEEAVSQQEIELFNLIRPALDAVRDKRGPLVFLVGFPIPSKAGEPACQMHWQAMLLPELSRGDQSENGFRPRYGGHWRRDRNQVLRKERELNWYNSGNWHMDQISTRGRFSNALEAMNILLIGSGALGSAIAEMLVRAGAHKLTIVDNDYVRVGNLTRHTLTMDSVGTPKSHSLADRLNTISPHGEIRSIDSEFPPRRDADRLICRQCDLILDCTGQDEVLHELEVFDWGGKKLFVSLSTGMYARRLFCFAAQGLNFPFQPFQGMVDPWLHRELAGHDMNDLPRDGIGCWHPAFPARADDLWLMASAAVKRMEIIANTPPDNPNLTVFEQQYDDSGQFTGMVWRNANPSVIQTES